MYLQTFLSQWFSAIAENGRNSRNRYFETELVVSRAYVKKGVAHAIIRPTCARVQRVRAHAVFKLKRTLKHVLNDG